MPNSDRTAWFLAIASVIASLCFQLLWIIELYGIEIHGNHKKCLESISVLSVKIGFSLDYMPTYAITGFGSVLIVLCLIMIHCASIDSDTCLGVDTKWRFLFRLLGYSLIIVAVSMLDKPWSRMYSPEYKNLLSNEPNCTNDFGEHINQWHTFAAVAFFALGVTTAQMLGFLSKGPEQPHSTKQTLNAYDFDEQKGLYTAANSLRQS